MRSKKTIETIKLQADLDLCTTGNKRFKVNYSQLVTYCLTRDLTLISNTLMHNKKSAG